MQDVMNFHMENVSEITCEKTPWRMVDKVFHRQKQSAVTGEPHGFVRPETTIVETSDFLQGVIAAAVSVAGPVVQQLEFSEHRDVHVCIQSTFQIRECCNFVSPQILPQDLGVEYGWSHNVRIPIKQRD